MRSILRSTLLASFALAMTWGLSGCEDTTKTTPPPPPRPPPRAPTTPAGKMEPADPTPTGQDGARHGPDRAGRRRRAAQEAGHAPGRHRPRKSAPGRPPDAIAPGGGPTADQSPADQAVLLQLAEEGAPGHPQQPGRLALVAPGLLQGVEQPVPLEGVGLGVARRPRRASTPDPPGRSAGRGPGRRPSTATGRGRPAPGATGRGRRRPGWRISAGRSSQGQRRAVGEDHRPLDHVLQLADVPRPVVGDQGLDRLVVDVADRPADPLGVPAEEVHGQLEDVLLALAERRRPDRDHVEPVEQVLAEPARRGSGPPGPGGSPRRSGRRRRSSASCRPARTPSPGGPGAAWSGPPG